MDYIDDPQIRPFSPQVGDGAVGGERILDEQCVEFPIGRHGAQRCNQPFGRRQRRQIVNMLRHLFPARPPARVRRLSSEQEHFVSPAIDRARQFQQDAFRATRAEMRRHQSDPAAFRPGRHVAEQRDHCVCDEHRPRLELEIEAQVEDGAPCRAVDAFLYPQGNQPPERAHRVSEPVIEQGQFSIDQMPVKVLQSAGPCRAVGSPCGYGPSNSVGQFEEAANR